MHESFGEIGIEVPQENALSWILLPKRCHGPSSRVVCHLFEFQIGFFEYTYPLSASLEASNDECIAPKNHSHEPFHLLQGIWKLFQSVCSKIVI